jgi:hypothetical protein
MQSHPLDLSGGQWRAFVPDRIGDTHPIKIVHHSSPVYRPGVRAQLAGRGSREFSKPA